MSETDGDRAEVKPDERSTRYTVAGIMLTLLALGGALGLAYWKRTTLGGLGLNEWGDFLAGTVGSLALIWIVVGYFQQGAELRNNATALRLQASELAQNGEALRAQVTEMAHSVEAQRALVELAKQDLEISIKLREEDASIKRRQHEPKFELRRRESDGHSFTISAVWIANTGAAVSVVQCYFNSGEGRGETGRWEIGELKRFGFPRGVSGRLGNVLNVRFRQDDARHGRLSVSEGDDGQAHLALSWESDDAEGDTVRD